MRLTGKLLWGGYIISGIVAIYLAASFWQMQHNRVVTMKKQVCLVEMKTLYAGTINAAFAGRYPMGFNVSSNEVLSGMGKPPRCPSGGTYVYPLVGAVPVCSVHGNLLGHDDEFKGPIRENESLWWVCKATVEKNMVTNVPQNILDLYGLTVESLNNMFPNIKARRRDR